MLWLLACKEPVVTVVGGRTTDLTVTLANPTSCDTCDAFGAVDTLRIDVYRGEEVVASDSFSYPTEAPEIPDLDGFGVVRIAMVGTGDGRVLSAGRTAEIALVPDTEQTATMVFAPANQALPLSEGMLGERSRHLAARLRDGRVLVAGGLDPTGSRASGTVEIYDPLTGAFSPIQATLPEPVADPRRSFTVEGDLLVTGGFSVEGPTTPGSISAARFDLDEDTFVEIGSLSQPRSGHCFAVYRDRQAVIFGGAEENPEAAEYGKRDEKTGDWTFTNIPIDDFDSNAATGCAAIADERVFVQGTDASSTGIWDFTDGGDPSESFRSVAQVDGANAHYVTGAMIRTLDDGSAWIAAGAESGTVVGTAWIFEPEEFHFREDGELATARFDGGVEVWIEAHRVVAACGWMDAERANAASSLEIFDIAAGASELVVDLDRDRPGCAATVLHDGSIVVTGGFGEADVGAVSAALVVPWIE